jgi:hypothetical protein
VSGIYPLHIAAAYSTVDVVKLLLKAYQGPLYEITRYDGNVLHLALQDPRQDRAAVRTNVQYFCDNYPDLLQMTNEKPDFLATTNETGLNPLSLLMILKGVQLGVVSNFNAVKILREANKSIERGKCQSINYKHRLPLYVINVNA